MRMKYLLVAVALVANPAASFAQSGPAPAPADGGRRFRRVADRSPRPAPVSAEPAPSAAPPTRARTSSTTSRLKK